MKVLSNCFRHQEWKLKLKTESEKWELKYMKYEKQEWSASNNWCMLNKGKHVFLDTILLFSVLILLLMVRGSYIEIIVFHSDSLKQIKYVSHMYKYLNTLYLFCMIITLIQAQKNKVHPLSTQVFHIVLCSFSYQAKLQCFSSGSKTIQT